MDLKKEKLILMSTHHLDDLKGIADEILWVKDQQVKQIDMINHSWVTWQISLDFKAQESQGNQEIQLIEIVEQVIQSMPSQKQKIKCIQPKKIASTIVNPHISSIDIQMDLDDIPIFNRLLVQHQVHVHAIFKPSVQSIDPFTI